MRSKVKFIFSLYPLIDFFYLQLKQCYDKFSEHLFQIKALIWNYLGSVKNRQNTLVFPKKSRLLQKRRQRRHWPIPIQRTICKKANFHVAYDGSNALSQQYSSGLNCLPVCSKIQFLAHFYSPFDVNMYFRKLHKN